MQVNHALVTKFNIANPPETFWIYSKQTELVLIFLYWLATEVILK